MKRQIQATSMHPATPKSERQPSTKSGNTATGVSLTNASRIFRLSAAWCVLLASGLTGCQSDQHTRTAASPGPTTVCGRCYDEIVKARSGGGPLGGLRTNKMISKHACEDCKTEMSIYTEQDVLMVRCPKCAPKGIACDRCIPPTGYAK